MDLLEEVKRRKETAKKKANRARASAMVDKPVEKPAEKPSKFERSAATAPGRLVAGMGKAVLAGPAEVGAFIGDALAKPISAALNIPQTEGLQPKIARKLTELRQAQERGGHEGVDVAGFLGELLGFAGAAPQAAGSFLGRVGQNAAFGAAGGAVSPSESTGDEYLSKQVLSSLFGAALSPVAGAIGDVAGSPVQSVQAIKDWMNPTLRAGKIMRTAADDPVAAAASMARAAPGETAGQATSRLGDTGIPGLESVSLAGSPQYRAMLRAQDRAREETLRGQGASQWMIDKVKSGRDLVTGPMREQALSRADIAKDVPRLAKDIENQQKILVDAFDDQQFLTDVMQLSRRELPSAEGMLAGTDEAINAADQVIARKMGQIRELTKLGNKPLVITEIDRGIGQDLKDPKAAGPNTQNALRALGSHLRSLADENGVIPAEALYAVRKNAGDLVEGQLKGTKADRAATASTLTNVRAILDDSIEKASGGGWKDYIETYAQMSHVIDRMRFMEGVRQKMVPAANEVGANLPHKLSVTSEFLGKGQEKLARKISSGVSDDVSKLLSDEQVKVLSDLRVSIGRQLQYEDLAKTGSHRAKELIGDPEIQSPRILWRPATIAMSILERLSGQIGEKTRAELQRLLLDPQVAAEVLKKANAKQVKMMFESGIISGLATAFPVAATPDS